MVLALPVKIAAAVALSPFNLPVEFVKAQPSRLGPASVAGVEPAITSSQSACFLLHHRDGTLRCVLESRYSIPGRGLRLGDYVFVPRQRVSPCEDEDSGA